MMKKIKKIARANSIDAKLNKLRNQIDLADRDLIRSLGQRFKAVEAVGKLKKNMEMPVVQKSRWDEVVADRVRTGKKQNLQESFIRDLLQLIHRQSIKIQRGIK